MTTISAGRLASSASNCLGGDPIDTLKQALTLAAAAVDKKAIDPVLLEVTDLVSYADHLLIVTGSSAPHVEAIVNACVGAASDHGMPKLCSEGTDSCKWVLVDFGDTVLHVFQPNERGYYDLEGLWIDAPRVEVPGVDPVLSPPGYVAS